MSNQTDHTIVRLRVPPELKQKIEESAEKNNRSQSAEMVARLEQSYNFSDDIQPDILNSFIQNVDMYTKQMKSQAKLLSKQSVVISKFLSALVNDGDKLDPQNYAEILDAIVNMHSESEIAENDQKELLENLKK